MPLSRASVASLSVLAACLPPIDLAPRAKHGSI